MSNKPIVYFEKNEAWLFDGENLTPCDYSAVKKYASGTSISLSNVQVGSFKFSSSLGEHELEVQTEIKMHEEGGLNSEIDYEIASFNHALEFESSTLVEVFASSHEEIQTYCSDILKKTKVIDWIVPSFITYSSYYVHNAIEAKTDLFYYLGDEEAYAVLFHKGSYIAHRKIPGIQELAKEIGVDEQRCASILRKYGLIAEACPEEDRPFISQLQGVFSKQVEKIVHTINHKRGLFGIEGIDRIFIDFKGNELSGLKDVFTAYGMENLESKSLVCNSDDSVNTHKFVKAMYIYLCENDRMPNALNMTPYERQAPWYQRHSGHLALSTAAAVLIALLHPGYFYIQGKILDEDIHELNLRVSSMEAQTKSLGVKLQALKNEVKKVESKVGGMKDVNKVHQITLDTLPLLMNRRHIRQKMMYDALDMLSLYKLSTVSLEQNGTQSMNIHVIADYTSRDKIAKFMKAWMASGYTEAKTKEIYLDENIYESKIEVQR